MLKLFKISPVFLLIFLFACQSWGVQLTLAQAKIIVLEKNHDVRVWMLGVDAARGELKSKKGVYDPELSFGTSYIDAKTPTASAFIETGIITANKFSFGSELSGRLPTGTFYRLYDLEVSKTETSSPVESLNPLWEASLGFSVGQELLRGFDISSNRVSVVISKKNRDISVHEFRRMVSKTLFSLERDYWSVIAATHNHELEKKAYELARDLEERTGIKVEAGVLPRVALTQAKAETAARKVRLINSENALNMSKDILKNNLSLPLEEPLELLETATSMSEIQEEDFKESDAVATAFEKRPELLRARSEIEKTKALSGFYSRQRLPRLSVEASLEYIGVGGSENPDRIIFGNSDPSQGISPPFSGSSNAYDSIRDRDFPSWSVTGVLSVPIFGRTSSGAYAKARAEHNRSIVNYRKQKDMIRLEVRNSIREIESSLKRMQAAYLSVELAREVLLNEEEKFKAGLSTTREILEAQRDLISAESAGISAFAGYRIALSDFERAKGTMIESNSFIIDNHSDIASYLQID